MADDIALEVSSPGAERTLIIPQDLDRFKVGPWHQLMLRNSSHTACLLFVQRMLSIPQDFARSRSVDRFKVGCSWHQLAATQTGVN